MHNIVISFATEIFLLISTNFDTSDFSKGILFL